MATDSELQQAVLQELKFDTRVHETDVGIEVDRGVVTLTGTVDSWGKRAAAQAAAHRVEGVLDVANDIRVRLPGAAGRSDTELARAVRHTLEWDARVPERRIRTTVTDGWVTLEGDVESWTQREDAEKAVRNLQDVRVVLNRIEIEPGVYTGDVRDAIVDALERHAVRTGQHITIEAQEGIVRLNGSVHSRAERDAIVGAARSTPGVHAVEDQLRIERTD
ncbi:MAG TPA: BON domain-containing protein [Polyangiales bacterium]|nr:BON domain-containing protein [Polyangiales bacterium]